jgi:hypothetical protein
MSDVQYTDDAGRVWRWRLYNLTTAPALFAVAFDADTGRELEATVPVSPADTEQTVENLKKAADSYSEPPTAPQEIVTRPYITLEEFRHATAHLPGETPLLALGPTLELLNITLDPAHIPEAWPSEDMSALILDALNTYDPRQF